MTPTSINASTLDFTKGKGELVAINVSTGNILWSKVFESINVGAATVVNDVVFTATFDGTIYGFRDHYRRASCSIIGLQQESTDGPQLPVT